MKSFLVFCAVLPLTAAEYFVGVKGNDSNPGTKDKPFRTIRKAASAAQAGDTVTLAPGRYAPPGRLSCSGKPGKPIVFRGTRGKNGEFLTVIDGSTQLSGWVPAPEAGPGVWSVPAAKRADCVTWNGLQLTLIGKRRMTYKNHKQPAELTDPDFCFDSSGTTYDRTKVLSGFDLMSLPEKILINHVQIDYKNGAKQPFWPVVKALAGWKNGRIYVRFADGKLPDGIFRAGRGRAFLLENVSHITIADMEICGADCSVEITGKESRNNVIRNCFLHHGFHRVRILNGASDNRIENNWMTMGHIAGYNMGSADWKINRAMYLTYKYIVTDNQTEEGGVRMIEPGSGNVISGNIIYQDTVGIKITGGGKTEVRNNLIREMTSAGVMPAHGSHADIHDNLLMDSGINLRVHSFHHANRPRVNRIFRNVFYQSPDHGMQIFIHAVSKHLDSPEQVWFCHNTIYGSHFFVNANGVIKRCRNRMDQNINWISNIVYGNQKTAANGMPFRIFHNNILRDTWFNDSAKQEGKYGKNLAFGKTPLFSVTIDNGFPALLPAENSPLLRTSLNLGKSCTVNGQTVPAMTGMSVIGARNIREDLSAQKKLFEISEKVRQTQENKRDNFKRPES